MSELGSWQAEQTLISLEDDIRVGSSISSSRIFPGSKFLYVEHTGKDSFRYRLELTEVSRDEAIELLAGAMR